MHVEIRTVQYTVLLRCGCYLNWLRVIKCWYLPYGPNISCLIWFFETDGLLVMQYSLFKISYQFWREETAYLFLSIFEAHVFFFWTWFIQNLFWSECVGSCKLIDTLSNPFLEPTEHCSRKQRLAPDGVWTHPNGDH
jgi:hypothetical protein